MTKNSINSYDFCASATENTFKHNFLRRNAQNVNKLRFLINFLLTKIINSGIIDFDNKI